MHFPKTPSSGKITRGITPSTLSRQAMEFVERQLPAWRDDKTRPPVDAEEDLNGQLCKFLNSSARDQFPMAMFHHEEKQGLRRRVDISVLPSREAITVSVFDSIYKPFLVLEGKRLPSPAADREREYITGLEKKSGGVQRFRLCLRGKDHSVALIIGYVQDGNVKDWRKIINGWIKSLKESGEDKTCGWGARDVLGKLANTGKRRASRCESNHARCDGCPGIRLVHLWVCMSPRAGRKKSA